jgi:diguanylate cyclase (GGDEF)-like protein
VVGVTQERGRVAGVQWKTTEGEGTIRCETIVNCGGQWAREFGRLAGVNVPLYSAEHFYLVTKQIPGVSTDMPVIRDPDGFLYYKEEVGGLVMGAAILVAPVGLPARIGLSLASALGGEILEHEARARHELRARSFTDRLTGLRNYDFFSEAMAAELARVRRYGGCTTLVLIDLDRFKAYNDRHGHGAGNRLLASVGRALLHEKRDADIAARFGGEEFAVLVPGRATDGVVLADRLRRAIAEVPAGRLDRHAVPDIVTASAGVATFPLDARDGDELFEIEDLVEKPSAREAPSNLAIAARYVLSPAIFEVLAQTRRGKGGEIQLTDAIRALIRDGGRAYGVRLRPDERRYDIGNFEAYFEAFVEFALADPTHGPAVRRHLLKVLDVSHS